MELTDLLRDIIEKLPKESRAAVEAIVSEFKASEGLQFALVTVTSLSKRQREVVRVLLNDLEKIEIAREIGKEKGA